MVRIGLRKLVDVKDPSKWEDGPDQLDQEDVNQGLYRVLGSPPYIVVGRHLKGSKKLSLINIHGGKLVQYVDEKYVKPYSPVKKNSFGFFQKYFQKTITKLMEKNPSDSIYRHRQKMTIKLMERISPERF